MLYPPLEEKEVFAFVIMSIEKMVPILSFPCAVCTPTPLSSLVDQQPDTFNRVPLAPVESARSLPARSTRLILLT